MGSRSARDLRAVGSITAIQDRYGDIWDLYLWIVNTDDLDRSGRTHWLVWHAVPTGTKPTEESISSCGNRTIGMRFGQGFDPAAHDLGHAFWRSEEHGRRGERPFVRGTDAHAAIIAQSMVALDALLESGRVP